MSRHFINTQNWTVTDSTASTTLTFNVNGIAPDFAVDSFVVNLNGTVTRGTGASLLPPECLSSMVTSIQYNAADRNGIVIPNVSGDDCELLFRARNGVRKGASLAGDNGTVDHDIVVPITPMVASHVQKNFRVLGSALNGSSFQVTLSLAALTSGTDGQIRAANLGVELHVLGQESSDGLTYSPFTIWKTSDFSGTSYSMSDMFLSCWYVDQRSDWSKLTLRTGVVDENGHPTAERQTVYNQLNARQIDDSDAKHGNRPPGSNETIHYTDTAGTVNYLYGFPSFTGNAAIQNIPFCSAGGTINQLDNESTAITGGGKSYGQLFDSRSAKASSPPYDVQFNERTASTAYAMIALGYRPG
jgi:hypothetical protein